MRSILRALLVLAAAALLAGCTPPGLSAVQRGMSPRKVKRMMGGEPLRIVQGDGVDVGKKTFVYADGRIHFVNQQVVLVEHSSGDPTITDRLRRHRDLEP